MSESLKSVGAITLFVEDPQRSKAFYGDVFDLPVIYEDENSARPYLGDRAAAPGGHGCLAARSIITFGRRVCLRVGGGASGR